MFKQFLFFSSFILSFFTISAQILDPAPYCISIYHNEISPSSDNHISNVTFSTINNTSGEDNYGYYNGFSAPVEVGMTYPLEVTLSGVDAYGLGVWIDYNQDSIFTDNERVVNIVDITGINGLQASNITIPSNAFNGTTRMRVRSIRDNLYFVDSAETVMLPCNSKYTTELSPGFTSDLFAEGETEDYNIQISGACVSDEANVYRFDFNGKNYHLVKELKDWENAHDCAEQREGKLVQIETEEEQNEIHVQMLLADIVDSATYASDGGGDDYIWLGGTDKDVANSWRWDGNNDGNGDQYWQGSSFGIALGNLYTNWGTNSPFVFGDRSGMAIKLNDNFFGDEAEWVDLNIMDSLFFLIEFPKLENGMNEQCIANFTTAPNNSNTHITNVSLETINHFSTNAGYIDYGDSIINLKAGLAYTLSYTVSGTSAHGVAAWIDYNANNVFENDEQIGHDLPTGGITPGVHTFGFNIPLTAALEKTVLRIRLVEDADEFVIGGSTEIDPCLEYNLGETEDYRINMIDQGLGMNPAVVVTSFQNILEINEDGGTIQFFAQTNPTEEPVVWSINPGTGNAIIDANGLLTPTADGTVTVVATAIIGGNPIEGTLGITISNQEQLLSLSHNNDSIQSVCDGDSENFSLFVDLKTGFVGNITFNLIGLPTGVTSSISPTLITEDGIISVTVTNTGAPFLVSDLDFIATVEGTGISDSIGLELRTFNGLPFNCNLISPVNNALNVSQAPTLDWSESLRADWYQLDIATDINFTNIIFTETDIATSIYNPSYNFLLNTEYFWRVQPQNPCGNGNWTPVFKYRVQPETGILGCTDNSALNYNSLAAVEDGSCEYPIEGCTDNTALNYNSDAVVDDGSCVLNYAAMIITEVNDTTYHFTYNSNVGNIGSVSWNFFDGSPLIYASETTRTFSENGIYPVEGLVYSSSTGLTYALIDTVIINAFGCTDPFAFNFNISASIDDGSCIDKVYGCTNPYSTNYNVNANTDDGSCSIVIFGCTDVDAFNYNATATNDDGTCIEKVFGCIDETAINYNEDANTDDGSCIATVNGCTDSTAYNYNENANVDDGSCEEIVYGCNDEDALNYNPLTNTNDGSCLFDAPNDDSWQITNTPENHSILIQNTINIEEIIPSIQTGDYLGVFYVKNDGSEQCGGRVSWTGANLALTAYGSETGLDNGFELNENFIWKLWRNSDNSVVEISAEYLTTQSHQGQYADDGVSAISKLAMGGSQLIELESGWNFISSNLNPVNPLMDSVFSSVNSDLFLTKDELGNVYWPSVNINNIGNHTIGEAYKVNMNVDAVLDIKGASITPEDYPLSLIQGWSYIGYLRNANANISSVMNSVVNNVFIMKDIDGNVFWPSFGINNIGNMEIGKGYQINMINDTTFTFPSNSTMLPSLKVQKNEELIKFNSVKTSKRHMHIGISELSWANEQPNLGDEIGIYFEKTLIGSGVWNGTNMVITIYGDDKKSWDNAKLDLVIHSNEIDEKLIVSTSKGNDIYFVENDVLIVNSLKRKTNPDIVLIVNEYSEIEYTNFEAINSSTISVEIYDYLGRRVSNKSHQVVSGELVAKLPELIKGVYLIKIVEKGNVLETIKWFN